MNPFAGHGWGPGRIDMGVDLAPLRREPVLAIGDAKILGSDSRSGWPGGHFIWYRLLDGDHAGDIIYVAEHLSKLAPAGTVVRAGTRIAVAHPGSPWTEWGWATHAGSTRAAPCYREGMATNSGREFARFLRSLGGGFIARPSPRARLAHRKALLRADHAHHASLAQGLKTIRARIATTIAAAR